MNSTAICFEHTDDSFRLSVGERTLIEASAKQPFLYAGIGEEDVKMYSGQFEISDYITERRPLAISRICDTGDGTLVCFEETVRMMLRISGDEAVLTFELSDPRCNRFWFRLRSDASEHYYGAGEQISYFDLKGRHFPLWSSEPGVGRDPSTLLTWKAQQQSHAGGDYYKTNYPQTTIVSSDCYFVHAESTAYADFDFRNSNFSELQFWALPETIRINKAPDFTELLRRMSALLGRQPLLPEWVHDGMILGLQGGTERVLDILSRSEEAGMAVAGLWCQDWCGKKLTSFGKRLFWNWQYHREMYPELPDTIAALNARGIRFMGYINPYLLNGQPLYLEAEEKGYLAKHNDGTTYLVDFGEFWCGLIDFTNPEACTWYKDRVIKTEMLDIGLAGWMADFGEYLPTDDLKLYDGAPAMLAHNAWPALWAKCNYEALSESGALGDAVYFMRAGGIGSQKYCTLLWAGDQSVDFTRHDGLITTVCAALSAGMSGVGLSHSDVGGYTSLFDNLRTKEVFLRWAEMSAFTPVMRSHEGNRPDTNFQYYDDEDCMKQLGRITRIFRALKPYRMAVVAENAEAGLPAQRPFFLHYDEERAYTEQFEYLFGRDLLVAPVWTEDAVTHTAWLPEDRWIHLWTGEEYAGGEVTVDAPIGYPPVFYRACSEYADLFAQLGALA